MAESKGVIPLVDHKAKYEMTALKNAAGKAIGVKCLDEIATPSGYRDYSGAGSLDVKGDKTHNGVADNVIGTVVTSETGCSVVSGFKFDCLTAPSVAIVEECGSPGLEHHVLNLSHLSVKMVGATNIDVSDLIGLVKDPITLGNVKSDPSDDSTVKGKVAGCIHMFDLVIEVGHPHCLDYPLPVKCGALVTLPGLGEDSAEGGAVVGKVVLDVHWTNVHY